MSTWPACVATRPRLALAGLALALISGFAIAQDTKPMGLMEPAFKFHLCVQDAAESEVKGLRRPFLKSPQFIEEFVWGRVLSACAPRISGAYAKGLILKHYGGDMSKSDAFVDGVMAAERAYVVDRVLAATKG